MNYARYDWSNRMHFSLYARVLCQVRALWSYNAHSLRHKVTCACANFGLCYEGNNVQKM